MSVEVSEPPEVSSQESKTNDESEDDDYFSIDKEIFGQSQEVEGEEEEEEVGEVSERGFFQNHVKLNQHLYQVFQLI